jgi:flagellar biosynthesis protein FlhF
MNIKRFIAKSNQEALRMVKKEMGPEAVILKTQTIHLPKAKSAGDTKRIEVTAAVDYDAPAFETQKNNELDPHKMDNGWRRLEKEIREIKETLFCIHERDMRMPDIYFDPDLRRRLMNYRHFGLHSDIIQGLMTEGLGDRHKQGVQTTSLLQESLFRVLSKIRIETSPHSKKGRMICSFIGPTGVGKTTTLAKLAAISALHQKKKTVLITLDTFRIAAVSQLKTYARIMGLPMEIASNGHELQKVIRHYSDCDRIFIDTAGRGPSQDQDIHELEKLLAVSNEIHSFLVLSATSGYPHLLNMDKRFNALPVQSYIFTKLDEIGDASSMLNFLVSQQKPVSYFSVGQQVPEDIEIASKKKIASMLLSEMREQYQNSVHKENDHGPSFRPSCDSQRGSKAISRH